MAIVRRTCSELAFIPGTTDIGLDDDLLRLYDENITAVLKVLSLGKGAQEENDYAK
jgi:hypothetical protein